MEQKLIDLHLVVSVGNVVILVGMLWKLSRLVQKVEMMWTVFSAEHGLDGKTGKRTET